MKGELEMETIKLRLIYNRDWNEYIVMVYIGGIYNEMKSYFTQCYDDAIDTMKAMQLHYEELGNQVNSFNRVKSPK